MTGVSGLRVVRGDVDSEDDETYDDIQEEMDDPWMARPAPIAAGVSSSSRVVGSIVQIDTQRLQELRSLHGQDGVCVLDVRSSEEYAAGSMGGSVNIPIAQLDSATARRVQGQAAVVVVVDPGDYRGQQACVRLTRVFGFPEALLLGLA
ncbi:MAG: hypothetical protein WDW38_006067 [Sanguina aurantia]